MQLLFLFFSQLVRFAEAHVDCILEPNQSEPQLDGRDRGSYKTTQEIIDLMRYAGEEPLQTLSDTQVKK